MVKSNNKRRGSNDSNLHYHHKNKGKGIKQYSDENISISQKKLHSVLNSVDYPVCHIFISPNK